MTEYRELDWLGIATDYVRNLSWDELAAKHDLTVAEAQHIVANDIKVRVKLDIAAHNVRRERGLQKLRERAAHEGIREAELVLADTALPAARALRAVVEDDTAPPAARVAATSSVLDRVGISAADGAQKAQHRAKQDAVAIVFDSARDNKSAEDARELHDQLAEALCVFDRLDAQQRDEAIAKLVKRSRELKGEA